MRLSICRIIQRYAWRCRFRRLQPAAHIVRYYLSELNPAILVAAALFIIKILSTVLV